MTRDQLVLAIHEAANYRAGKDSFISDLLLSAVFLPDDENAGINIHLAQELEKIWNTMNLPFRELLDEWKLTQIEFSRRFFIPYRTVQDWAAGKRTCASYLRLMISALCGYIELT